MVKKVKLKIELKKEMEIELFHVVEGRVAVPGRGLRPAAGRTCFTEGLLLAQKPVDLTNAGHQPRPLSLQGTLVRPTLINDLNEHSRGR